MPIEKMSRVFFGFTEETFEKQLASLINSGSIEPINFVNIIDQETQDQVKRKEVNPYEDVFNEMSRFLNIIDYEPELDKTELETYKSVDIEKIRLKFEKLNESAVRIFDETKRMKKKLSEYKNILFHMNILSNLSIELGNLNDLERIRLIFGKIPKERYKALIESVTNLPILFLEVKKEKNLSWIFVLTPPDYLKETYDILHSAYFEEDSVPLNYKGTPKEIKQRMESSIKHTELSIRVNEIELQRMFYDSKEFIDKIYPHILLRKRIYDLSDFGVYSNDSNVFYLSGWIPEGSISRVIDDQERQILQIEKAEKLKKSEKSTIPTKLVNQKGFFKGFEILTNLFGTPKYEEIDPTPFVAILFTLMFGLMLGDIGHGSILLLAAFLLRNKWGNLSHVLMSASVSSIVFGFLYGSIFGFEAFHPIWLRPSLEIEQLMTFSIYLGIATIICGFLINIINGILQKDWEKAIFSEKGIAGNTLYLFLVYSAVNFLSKGSLPLSSSMFFFIVISLSVLIFLSEPLGTLIKGEKPKITGEFWLTSGVNLMNSLLEYLSNTISFVRLAAFALTHSALFTAFWTLTLMVKPVPGGAIFAFLVFMIGQFFLIALEGLVVFIQDLRLTYYEYFTKFYEGTGKPFKPFGMDEENT